jgi:hypothetical protein
MKNVGRRKEFMSGFWGTFIAVLALPSALLTILGMHFSVVLTSGLLLFALTLSAVINKRRWTKRHLPVGDIVPEGIERIGRSTLRCPCDLRLADEAKRLAQYWYPTETITPDRFEQLRMKNPYILACLIGTRNELLGYFDVIPLGESFAHQFLRGTITESSITHEDVLPPGEMAVCKYLFISGLAVWNPDDYVDRRNANILVWGLLKYLDHFYGQAGPLVFASAATKEGEELLQKFGLEIHCEAALRVDRRRLYALPLSPEEIAKRIGCLPDWSFLCSLDWSPGDTSGRRKNVLPGRKLRSIKAA